jgi:hypothetical protein
VRELRIAWWLGVLMLGICLVSLKIALSFR